MGKLSKLAVGVLLCSSFANAADVYQSGNTNVPNLTMKNTGLSFKDIEGYKDYRIIATHFRKDKNEIRYVLANPVAFNALRNKAKVMPNGGKVVKIGWSVNEMPTFPSALEADKIQRVEYMIKDVTKHKESDGWGYARFVKKNGKYQAWGGDPKSCVACHAGVSSTDFLFTKFQKRF